MISPAASSSSPAAAAAAAECDDAPPDAGLEGGQEMIKRAQPLFMVMMADHITKVVLAEIKDRIDGKVGVYIAAELKASHRCLQYMVPFIQGCETSVSELVLSALDADDVERCRQKAQEMAAECQALIAAECQEIVAREVDSPMPSTGHATPCPSSTASSGDGSRGSTGQSTTNDDEDDDSDDNNTGATPITCIRRANTTGMTTPSSPSELPGVAAPTPGQPLVLEQLPSSAVKKLRLKFREEFEAEALAANAGGTEDAEKRAMRDRIGALTKELEVALAANNGGGTDEVDAAKRDTVAARKAQKKAEEEVARQAKQMEEMKLQLVQAEAEKQKQKDIERATTSSTGTPSRPNGDVGSPSSPFTSAHTPRRSHRSSILEALSAAGRILSPRTEKVSNICLSLPTLFFVYVIICQVYARVCFLIYFTAETIRRIPIQFVPYWSLVTTPPPPRRLSKFSHFSQSWRRMVTLSCTVTSFRMSSLK